MSLPHYTVLPLTSLRPACHSKPSAQLIKTCSIEGRGAAAGEIGYRSIFGTLCL